MKTLLVCKNAQIRQRLWELLKASRNGVDEAGTDDGARFLLSTRSYDAVVLHDASHLLHDVTRFQKDARVTLVTGNGPDRTTLPECNPTAHAEKTIPA